MSKKEYEKKRDAKRVSFNVEKEKELLEFANSVDFSNRVKQKIKEALNWGLYCYCLISRTANAANWLQASL